MIYKYRCESCQNLFEISATIAEKEAGIDARCPHCGSTRTTQVFGVFGIKMNPDPGRRGSRPGGCGCSGGCG